jgi:hypothetical protein
MRILSRRWWFGSAVALLLAGLLTAAGLYISFGLSHRDRVTMSHLAKLKLGMLESDVRQILGEDPAQISCARESRWNQVDPSWSAEEWKGRSMEVRILFDGNGRMRDWTATATGKFDWRDRVLNWIDWIGF